MHEHFFPTPVFGWCFVALLVGFTTTSTILDWRSTLVPNWLTVSILGVGIVVTLTRLGWMGAAGRPLWVLDSTGVWYGILSAVLFILAGFLVAFGVMFVSWVLGTCGGGDVKLVSALGVWLGPKMILFSYFGTFAVICVVILVKVFYGGVSVGKLRKKMNQRKTKKPETEPGKPDKFRLTYSFPVAVATLAVLLWYSRVDLELVPPPKEQTRVQNHAR